MLIRVKTSRAQVRNLTRQFVSALTGRVPNWQQLVHGVNLRMSTALLSQIQQDFVTKARGGTGKDGIKWQPLKKETIANRRPAPRKKLGERPRGLLTEAEDARWRRIFAQTKAWLIAKHGLDDAEAAGRAAQTAWNKLKASGAKTKLEVYGNRQVEILRDTDLTLLSLSPGVTSPDQVLRLTPGTVIVGTNRNTWHHRGNRRLPQRRFWPDPKSAPAGYWNPLVLACRRGIVEALASLLTGRAA